MSPSTSSSDRGAAIRKVLWITLVLNLAVALAKIAYGSFANSLSLRADGFHSLTDSSNNLLGLVGTWWASRPPDEKHPYGHEKVEVLAAGAVGASLIAVAWDVVSGALGRVLGEQPPPRIGWGAVIVLLGTLAVNTSVAYYEGRKAKQLNSPFLASDAAHTRSDVLVTTGVLATVGCVHLGYHWADAVAALGIAVFIFMAGLRVLRSNLDYLLDAAQIDESEVLAVVSKVPGVASAHKIRTRGVPGAVRIDLHIQIARHLQVADAHRVTHWAIEALKADLDGVTDVVIHTEPAPEGAAYPELPASMHTDPSRQQAQPD